MNLITKEWMGDKKKKAVSDPSVEADVCAGEMAYCLEEMFDTLEQAGKEYYGLAKSVGDLDAKLLRLMNKADFKTKRQISDIILKAMKDSKVELSDSISAELYTELNKYGTIKYTGRSPQFTIVRV